MMILTPTAENIFSADRKKKSVHKSFNRILAHTVSHQEKPNKHVTFNNL